MAELKLILGIFMVITSLLSIPPHVLVVGTIASEKTTEATCINKLFLHLFVLNLVESVNSAAIAISWFGDNRNGSWFLTIVNALECAYLPHFIFVCGYVYTLFLGHIFCGWNLQPTDHENFALVLWTSLMSSVLVFGYLNTHPNLNSFSVAFWIFETSFLTVLLWFFAGLIFSISMVKFVLTKREVGSQIPFIAVGHRGLYLVIPFIAMTLKQLSIFLNEEVFFQVAVFITTFNPLFSLVLFFYWHWPAYKKAWLNLITLCQRFGFCEQMQEAEPDDFEMTVVQHSQ